MTAIKGIMTAFGVYKQSATVMISAVLMVSLVFVGAAVYATTMQMRLDVLTQQHIESARIQASADKVRSHLEVMFAVTDMSLHPAYDFPGQGFYAAWSQTESHVVLLKHQMASMDVLEPHTLRDAAQLVAELDALLLNQNHMIGRAQVSDVRALVQRMLVSSIALVTEARVYAQAVQARRVALQDAWNMGVWGMIFALGAAALMLVYARFNHVVVWWTARAEKAPLVVMADQLLPLRVPANDAPQLRLKRRIILS